MRHINLQILDERLKDKALQPAYATPGSAGLDIRACLTEATVLEPGQTLLIPTGLAMHLADPSLVALLMPRSSLGHKHGVVLSNMVGVLDADYTNQIFVAAWNRSQTPYTIAPLERIAQMLIIPVVQVGFTVVDALDTTERAGGFGSTGKS